MDAGRRARRQGGRQDCTKVRYRAMGFIDIWLMYSSPSMPSLPSSSIPSIQPLMRLIHTLILLNNQLDPVDWLYQEGCRPSRSISAKFIWQFAQMQNLHPICNDKLFAHRLVVIFLELVVKNF